MILSCFAFTGNQPSAVNRHAEIVAESDSLGARFHRRGSFSDPQPGEIFCLARKKSFTPVSGLRPLGTIQFFSKSLGGNGSGGGGLPGP
jgi:hypothetical protein